MQVYQKLKENLITTISLPQDLRDVVKDIVPWKDFCGLSSAVKDEFSSSEFGIGYPSYVSQTSSEKPCIGEYLHVCEDDTRNSIYFNSRNELMFQYSEVKAILEYTRNLNVVLLPYIKLVGYQISSGVPKLKKILDENNYRVLIRYLHYYKHDYKDIIAKHFDRGLYALYLYESCPGVDYLDLDNKLVSLNIEAGKERVFCGYQMEVITGGSLKKMWYRVNNPKTKEGRYALVAFVWSDKLPTKTAV